MSVTVSHFSTPPLKAALLSPSLTVRLMSGPNAAFCALLVIHCFPRYLWILHAILVLLLCCVWVISLPSLLLSLHYLRGYLGVVVPVLSRSTIKVVTFLFDGILKCTQRRLGSFLKVFFFFFFLTATDRYF